MHSAAFPDYDVVSNEDFCKCITNNSEIVYNTTDSEKGRIVISKCTKWGILSLTYFASQKLVMPLALNEAFCAYVFCPQFYQDHAQEMPHIVEVQNITKEGKLKYWLINML